MLLRLDRYGVIGLILGQDNGCSEPSRWRPQQINFVKVRAYRSRKVSRRERSMSTSGRSSVSADVSGIALPASWRPAAGWCESSAGASPVGNDSSPSGSTAGSVSNWSASSASMSTSGSFPTGGRMAGATLRLVRTSLQACVGTHRQVLLQAKPSSRPKVPRRPVCVYHSGCPSMVATSGGNRHLLLDSQDPVHTTM